MSKEIKGIDPKSYGSFDKVMDKARRVSRYVLPGVAVALTASCTPEMINALAKTVETPEVSPLPSDFTKTPAPLSTEANYELTPTVVNPATQELTLVSPTEVATEMPTITLTPEPTATFTPEPTATVTPESTATLEPTEEIREIRPLTDISGQRIPDKFSFLTYDDYSRMYIAAFGVISGFGTDETKNGILNDYILIDVGKGKFKVLTSSEFIFGAGLLDGTNMAQPSIKYSTYSFEEIMPFLAIGKGIKMVFVAEVSRDDLCLNFPPRGGSSAFTDEECINSLSSELIGNRDLNYLQSVMDGETVTSTPVELGIISTLTLSKHTD